jgi:hypothetical protein
MEEVVDSTQILATTDQTLYGLCTDGSAMNTLQLLTDNGDTISLSLTAALEAGQVFGGYQVGDRMAVLTNPAKTEATLVINESTLLGDWVMPNPIDGSSEVGIRLKRVVWLRASIRVLSSIRRGKSSTVSWSCSRSARGAVRKRR